MVCKKTQTVVCFLSGKKVSFGCVPKSIMSMFLYLRMIQE